MRHYRNPIEGTSLFLCKCESAEHQVILKLYDWEADRDWSAPDPVASSIIAPSDPQDCVELAMEVHLSNFRGFFGRVWHAIKYVLGYRCRFGDFDTMYVKYGDVDNLIKVLIVYKQRVEDYARKLDARRLNN